MKRVFIIALILLTIMVACGVENSSNADNISIEKVTNSGKIFSIEDLKKMLEQHNGNSIRRYPKILFLNIFLNALQ